MEYKDKLRLSEAINELPANKLAGLVKIISRETPPTENAIEVDLDLLPVEVLREIELYIAKHAHQGPGTEAMATDKEARLK